MSNQTSSKWVFNFSIVFPKHISYTYIKNKQTNDTLHLPKNVLIVLYRKDNKALIIHIIGHA